MECGYCHAQLNRYIDGELGYVEVAELQSGYDLRFAVVSRFTIDHAGDGFGTRDPEITLGTAIIDYLFVTMNTGTLRHRYMEEP